MFTWCMLMVCECNVFASLILLIVVFFICTAVDVKKNVVVTVSSDKGLCGGINSTSVKISRVLSKLNSGKFYTLLRACVYGDGRN